MSINRVYHYNQLKEDIKKIYNQYKNYFWLIFYIENLKFLKINIIKYNL